MSYELTMDLEPYRLTLQFTLRGGSFVGFTGKALIREMPALLSPTVLGFARLSLHAQSGLLLGCSCPHDNPPFGHLWQRHLSAKPVYGSILRVLPGLAAFLQDRFRFLGCLWDTTHPLDPCLVLMPHIRL